LIRFNQFGIKSYQIDVKEPKTKMEFIDALKTNTDLWLESEELQCYLYVKQQGAGSGKTFEMIQLLNNNTDFSHYKDIIIITKQHSAVYVIYKEFSSQYEQGLITNLELIKPSTLKELKSLRPTNISNRHFAIKIEPPKFYTVS